MGLRDPYCVKKMECRYFYAYWNYTGHRGELKVGCFGQWGLDCLIWLGNKEDRGSRVSGSGVHLGGRVH